jgi:hypothetical protein
MPARGQRYLRNRGEKFKLGQYFEDLEQFAVNQAFDKKAAR